MNKSWFYLGAIGSLAILMTSCGGDSGKPAAPAASTAPAASPAPAPAAAAPTAPATPIATTKPAPTTAVVPPTVPATPTATKPVSVDIAAGLIPPTDGDNWARTVSKGRPDPFAILALQPVEVAEKDPLDGTGQPQRSSSKIASQNLPPVKSVAVKSGAVKSGVDKPLPTIKISAIPTKPTNVAGNQKIAKTGIFPSTALPKTVDLKTAKSGAIKANPGSASKNNGIRIAKLSPAKVTPGSASNNSLRATKLSPATASKIPGITQIAAKPENVAAKPLQAMALEISGMIEVEGRTQVIVKLPSESFSRYIEVGDRVANGKILVKRIEGQNSLSPTVVLEEVGVEVSRKIGDRPAPISPDLNPNSQSKPQ